MGRVEGSVCLTTDHEVAGSILDNSTILNVDQVWEGSSQNCEDIWVATYSRYSGSD